MKKHILLLSAILLPGIIAFSQSGYFSPPPPPTGYFIIPSGAYLHISGSPSLVLDNTSLTNNGNYVSASDELLFTGNVAQTIGGTSNNTFNKLTSDNSGGVTLNSNTIVNDAMTILSGAKIELATGKTLTVDGTTTNDGTFTIKADAAGMGSFIDNGIAGSGTYNVERWVSSDVVNRWEYISSPVTTASSSLFTSATHGLYYADETNNAWVKITDAVPQNMNVLQGYTRNYVTADGDGNVAVTFTGTVNTGSQSIGLSRTDVAPGVNHGYNLVGNPYTCAMDWDAVSGWTKTNLDDAIYFRSGGTYGSYVGGIATGNASNIIPPMQAFWVRATVNGPASLACDNNVRIHDSQNIYKINGDNTLHLTVNNIANGLNDDTYIRFMDVATDGFDSQYDAYKMFAVDAAYPQVYTNNGTDDISINSLSDLSGERTVALGFNTTLSGDYTITADLASSFTDLGNTVYLEDQITGTYQELSASSTYPFTSTVETGLNRFILHFNPSITGIAENTENQIQIFAYNNEVHINSSDIIEGDVNVFDLVGQLIASKHVSGTTSDVIRLKPVSAVYIVKFIASENIVTKRIFINQ